MNKILLCSSNPLLVKNLYGVLRDEGNAVEIVEHPALAVRQALWSQYDFVIVDSEPFGMSAAEAASVIMSVSPGTPVMMIADDREAVFANNANTTLDLDKFNKLIHASLTTSSRSNSDDGLLRLPKML